MGWFRQAQDSQRTLLFLVQWVNSKFKTTLKLYRGLVLSICITHETQE